MSNFQQKLKQLRDAHGLTQEMLGNKLGLAKSTISMYENGNREPSFEILEAIADVFNVRMAELVQDDSTSLSSLTDEELSVISNYRLLNDEGRAYIRATLSMTVSTYAKQTPEN